jgi:hypothetical protein
MHLFVADGCGARLKATKSFIFVDLTSAASPRQAPSRSQTTALQIHVLEAITEFLHLFDSAVNPCLIRSRATIQCLLKAIYLCVRGFNLTGFLLRFIEGHLCPIRLVLANVWIAFQGVICVTLLMLINALQKRIGRVRGVLISPLDSYSTFSIANDGVLARIRFISSCPKAVEVNSTNRIIINKFI